VDRSGILAPRLRALPDFDNDQDTAEIEFWFSASTEENH
jgi:hypothetical protein